MRHGWFWTVYTTGMCLLDLFKFCKGTQAILLLLRWSNGLQGQSTVRRLLHGGCKLFRVQIPCCFSALTIELAPLSPIHRVFPPRPLARPCGAAGTGLRPT